MQIIVLFSHFSYEDHVQYKTVTDCVQVATTCAKNYYTKRKKSI